MIEIGFRGLLAAEPSIADIVSDRISWVNLNDPPAGETGLPAIVLHRVGNASEDTFGGSGYQRLRVELEFWAEDWLGSATLQEAVRGFLANLDVPVQLSDGTLLGDCEYIQPLDYYDNDAEAFRCGSEWYLHFTFPAPAGNQ